MKPLLYSHDINHLFVWEQILDEYEIIDDINTLKGYQDRLMIIDYDSKKDTNELIKSLSSDNLILVLDAMPNMAKAKNLLRSGVRGYGNVLMSKVYMYAALESLKEGNIWLIPTLTKELIQGMELPQTSQTEAQLLALLSPAQKEVALLLKDGLNNKEIAKRQNVSINTIKSQIKSIYVKLGVNDKVGFIMLFK